MITVGIDPGQTGGVAVVIDRRFYAGTRMPIITHGKRKLVDTKALDDWIFPTLQGEEPHLTTFVLEQVNSMRGQGLQSTFNFGRHTGAVEGWSLSYGAPIEWVTPAKWKGHFKLSRDKQQSLDKARLKFGDNPLWKVKANDGVAEAALIALWWQETVGG